MNYLTEKVAYLKGLAEGLGVEESSKEGKLLLHIVDTLEEFADVIHESIENQMELEEYVNFMDEDLADLEEDIYGIDEEYYDEDDFDFEDFDFEDYCDDECCIECEENHENEEEQDED